MNTESNSTRPCTARLALEESRCADTLRELRQLARMPEGPAPTGYNREARRIHSQMRADGLLPDRRRGVGPGALHAAKAAGLALVGFAYLAALVSVVALVADFAGVAL